MPELIKSEIDILSEYYRSELAYLRDAGADFSTHFPKIARRLDLSREESSDPHVERLIESFAFLTGKLQKQIDDQYPETAYALLAVIFKPLVLPVPSCVMVNFDIDLARAQKNAGITIPRHTILTTTGYDGTVCSFRTAHDLQIWPMELVHADIAPREQLPLPYAEAHTFLRLDIKYLPSEKSPKKLRFYITADALLRGKIFAGIFSTDAPVILKSGQTCRRLTGISPVGLEDNESLLVYNDNLHKGFRFIQEYFAFPDKFYGFDVEISSGAEELLKENFSLYIPIGVEISAKVRAKDFSLSVTPAINLFPKVTEPLRLDNKQVNYRLVPDFRLYHSHEIYIIKKMVAIDALTNDEIEIPEFYSYDHFSTPSSLGIAWVAKRKDSLQKDGRGDDALISFVDEKFNPQYPADKIFYAHTLCTNRHLAEDVPVHGKLQTELSLPVREIYCVNRPTPQRNSLKSGAVLWKLISAVSMNSLSFSSAGMIKLKELLKLFSDTTGASLEREIDSILEIKSEISVKRMAKQSWFGFVNGTEIEITVDDNIYNKCLPLSLIISRFLSTYTTVNTYVDVKVKSQSGLLKKWETQFGRRAYI